MNGSFRIIQLTDTHLLHDKNSFLRQVNTWRTLNQVVHNVIQNYDKPDLLFLTGDLSDDGSTNSYHLLAKATEKIHPKPYALNGNHDNKKNFIKMVQEGILNFERILHRANWSFIFLDSCVDGKNYGFLEQSELDFLKQTLQQFSHQQIVICLHHHPVPVHSYADNYILQNYPEFLDLINQFNHVKLVLFGHIHQEFTANIKGIQFLGTPATCEQARPFSKTLATDFLLPGYRIIDFFPDGFHTTVKRVLV